MITREEIINKINHERALHFSWKFISDKDYMYVFSLLHEILLRLDKLYLFDHLQIILRELLANANRATAKRIFFKNNNINIEDEKEYEENIIFFKTKVIENWDSYKDELENSNYFVNLSINWSGEGIEFIISHNSSLLSIEKKRIEQRLKSSEQYKTIVQAYRDHSDQKESAGLGILLCILLLRSMGLGPETLQIYSEENKSISRILIPHRVIPLETLNLIYEKLTTEIKMLPSLSDSLKRIIKICHSPEMDMKILVDEIEKNPAVSADILKLSNSVGYFNRAKPNDLSIAVKKLGSNGILRMIYAISTIRIMNSRYAKMEEEWEHARRTSYFAERLASESHLSKIADTVGMGALLHDIGKILLLSIEPNLFPSIMEMAKSRALENSKVLEEISLGVSHSEIGYMLARKWNFPEDLTYIIACHHQPWDAPEEFIAHCEPVYLANMMTHYIKGDIKYYNINLQILENFNIDSEEVFKKKVHLFEESFQIEDKDRIIDA
jgi:putative nucleotidyltransferase with HDIG domain